jgi:thymidylate synthase
MRIFANCLEARKEIERSLFEMGTEIQSYSMQDKIVLHDENFLTKELQGYSYSILKFSDVNDLITDKEELLWCVNDFEERISSDYINPGEAWQKRGNVWMEFLHDGKFSYTYNERIRTQLDLVIDELKIHRSSRQAIIEIHNNIIDIQNMGGKKRIPCSMFYQFLFRNGQLDIYYVMRSCDFITHWRYDVWQAVHLLKYVAGHIGVEYGKFMHYITSLHSFRKDMPGGIF